MNTRVLIMVMITAILRCRRLGSRRRRRRRRRRHECLHQCHAFASKKTEDVTQIPTVLLSRDAVCVCCR